MSRMFTSSLSKVLYDVGSFREGAQVAVVSLLPRLSPCPLLTHLRHVTSGYCRLPVPQTFWTHGHSRVGDFFSKKRLQGFRDSFPGVGDRNVDVNLYWQFHDPDTYRTEAFGGITFQHSAHVQFHVADAHGVSYGMDGVTLDICEQFRRPARNSSVIHCSTGRHALAKIRVSATSILLGCTGLMRSTGFRRLPISLDGPPIQFIDKVLNFPVVLRYVVPTVLLFGLT